MIYLDAATTVPTDDDTRLLISEILRDNWGNVSGAHQASRKAKNLLEDSRETVSNLLGTSPDQIVFTSGATESLNLAIQGYSRAHRQATIWYSAVEHPAVKKPSQFLGKQGVEIRELKVDSNGKVDLSQLEKVKQDDLVCIMPVNNEVGTVNEIESIATILKEKNAKLLLDCVQSFYAYEISSLCKIADYAIISGHKLGAPQGVGLLVIKDRKSIDPLVFGGSQEWELRPGTTPAFLIAAFSQVLAKRIEDRDNAVAHLEKCQKLCIDLIKEKIPGSIINAEEAKRSPHIVSLRIPNTESQLMVVMVDKNGLCVSRGSACASGAQTPSPVLMAMGIDEKETLSTLRLSFHSGTTFQDIENGIEIISKCADELLNKMPVGVK